MGAERETKWYRKEWNPEFEESRSSKANSSSWVECKRAIRAQALLADQDDPEIKSDYIENLLEDFDDYVPSCVATEVGEFCVGTCLLDLELGKDVAGRRRAAWLDDRISTPPLPTPRTPSKKSRRLKKKLEQRDTLPRSPQAPLRNQCARNHDNPLTATGLYRSLKVPRIDNEDIPAVDRRLICIQNLDPYYIFALLETASFREILVLRHAIWRHLAFQTLISVKLNARGYPTFRMEFHIPYFALRDSPAPDDIVHGNVLSGPSRQCIDLSFLKIQRGKSQDQTTFRIHEASISLILCGTDKWNWTAWAFIDTYNILEIDQDLSEEFTPPIGSGFLVDPIAGSSEEGLKVNANDPIRDPRSYFLTILEIRSVEVLKEWQWLARNVERSITKYIKKHPSNLSQRFRTAGGRSKDVKKIFDWLQQAIELLRRLMNLLSETINAWEKFRAPNGDIGYFSNISMSPNIPQNRQQHLNGIQGHPSLSGIQETFEMLVDVRQKLFELNEACKTSAHILQLRLTIEGNESAQHTVVTQELMALIVSPCMIAVAYFTIPQATIPFTWKSFIVSFIVLMIALKAFFFLLSTLPSWTWMWKKVRARIKTARLDATYLSANGLSGRISLRRNGTQQNITTETKDTDVIV